MTGHDMTGIDMQIFLENTILHDRVTLEQLEHIIEGNLEVGHFTISNVKQNSDMEELDYYIDISFEELEIDIEVFLLPTREKGVYYITEIGSYWW